MPRATFPGVGNKSLPDQRTARPHAVRKSAAMPTGLTIRQRSASVLGGQTNNFFPETRFWGAHAPPRVVFGAAPKTPWDVGAPRSVATGSDVSGEAPDTAREAPAGGRAGSALRRISESALIALSAAPTRTVAPRFRRLRMRRRCNPRNAQCRLKCRLRGQVLRFH